MTPLTGNDISNLRKKLGFTQEQLAEKIKVSLGTIRRWEQQPKEKIGGIMETQFRRWANRQPQGKLPKKYCL